MPLRAPARRAVAHSRVIVLVVILAIVAYAAIYLALVGKSPNENVHDKQEQRTLRATHDNVVDFANQLAPRVLALEQKTGSIEGVSLRAQDLSATAAKTATRLDTAQEAAKVQADGAAARLDRIEQLASQLESKLTALDANASRAASSLRETRSDGETDRTKLAQLESILSGLHSEIRNVRTETANAIARVGELERKFQLLSDQSLAAQERTSGRLTSHKSVRVVLVGHDEPPEAGRANLSPTDKHFRWSPGQDSNFDVGRFGRFVVAATISGERPVNLFPAQLSVFDLGSGHCYLKVDVNHIEIMSRSRATGVYVLLLAVTHTD